MPELPESLAPLHNRPIFFRNGKDRNSLFHTTAETSNIAFQGQANSEFVLPKSHFRRARRGFSSHYAFKRFRFLL